MTFPLDSALPDTFPPAGSFEQGLPRRDFLRRSVAAAATLGAASGFASRLAAAEPQSNSSKPMFKVVDSHQHLWDLKKFRLPWTAASPALARDFTMRDYLAATAGIPIEKSVYLEVDVEPSQQQAEIDYVAGLCRRGEGPLAAAVISGRPAADNFRDYITPFKGHPHIRGLRQVLHGDSTPQGTCLQKSFIAGIQYLGELGLSFDICMRAPELPDAARLIDACPGTSFILDHCGNADVRLKDQIAWKHDIAAVAQRKNVVVKVSGIIARATPGKWTVDDLAPIVNHTLDVFGPDRVMFGGDWPVCTLGASYKQWFDALREIVANRPETEQRRLFHDNAVRHYRLA
jgi:predicted TIM-barrel fold metal-dependent hydrolase